MKTRESFRDELKPRVFCGRKRTNKKVAMREERGKCGVEMGTRVRGIEENFPVGRRWCINRREKRLTKSGRKLIHEECMLQLID